MGDMDGGEFRSSAWEKLEALAGWWVFNVVMFSVGMSYVTGEWGRWEVVGGLAWSAASHLWQMQALRGLVLAVEWRSRYEELTGKRRPVILRSWRDRKGGD